MVNSELSDFGRFHQVDDATIQDAAKIKVPRALQKRPRVVKGDRFGSFHALLVMDFDFLSPNILVAFASQINDELGAERLRVMSAEFTHRSPAPDVTG